MGQGTPDGYYGEVRIIPWGSRSESGTPIGAGPGLRELPRIPIPRTPVNKLGIRPRFIENSSPIHRCLLAYATVYTNASLWA